MNTPPTAAVLIVNYHSSESVGELLSDLAASDACHQLVVSIVDNSNDSYELSSIRRTAAPFRTAFANLIVTDARANLGYAAGNNAAYRAIESRHLDVILVCNPDVRVSTGSLRSFLSWPTLKERGVAVPLTEEDDEVLDGRGALHRCTGRTRKLRVGEQVSPSWLTYPGGHFTAFSFDFWSRVGGLSEDFFLYGEEADVVLRGGIRATPEICCDELVVHHDSGGTTGSARGSRSATTLFHAARSSMVLFRKHRNLRPALPLALIARIGFAAKIAMHQASGSRVVLGIIAGLTYKPTRLTSRVET